MSVMPKNKSMKGKIDCIYGKSDIAKFIKIAEEDPERLIPKTVDAFTKFVMGNSNVLCLADLKLDQCPLCYRIVESDTMRIKPNFGKVCSECYSNA